MSSSTTAVPESDASKRSLTGGLARVAVLVLVLVLVVGSGPGIVAAQSIEGPDGVDGTVTVEEGETVDSVEAFAGNVIVDGTVTGDVNALAGNVYVNGEVEGDVSVASGNLEVDGNVSGDVSAAAGNVRLAENGSVGGDFQAGGGTVLVDGTIDGDAAIGADTIELGETAAISGDLEYSGDLQGETGVVEGEITEDSSVGVGPDTGLEPIVTWVFALYTLALNLLLGAALLLLFPRFSAGVADRVGSVPVRAGLVGLAVLIIVPIALIALAITVVGIPLSIIGGFVFALFVWIGIVYGRFAVAAWLLSLVGIGNRWLALVVGLIGGAILAQIPIIGPIVNFLIFLLGLGALSMTLYSGRRRGRESTTPTGTDEPTAD